MDVIFPRIQLCDAAFLKVKKNNPDFKIVRQPIDHESEYEYKVLIERCNVDASKDVHASCEHMHFEFMQVGLVDSIIFQKFLSFFTYKMNDIKRIKVGDIIIYVVFNDVTLCHNADFYFCFDIEMVTNGQG